MIVSNKQGSAKSIVLFHNGCGSQKAIFGDAKSDVALDMIPCRRLVANQAFTLCSMMAHNLSRELPAMWTFQRLDTIRHKMIQRAGRLTKPASELTLTMSAHQSVRKDLLRFLETLQMAA